MFPSRRAEATPLRTRGSVLAAPLLLFVLGGAILAVAAAAQHTSFTQPGSWDRADSGQYLKIAAHGYRLFRCPPAYPAGSWCGDSGWFIAYPALIAVLLALGLHAIGGAVLLAWLFLLATLFVLWQGLLRDLPRPGAWIGLAFAALAPSEVYLHAAFPMSMAAFFVTLTAFLLLRDRPLPAAAAAAVAAAAYPTAILVAPAVAGCALAGPKGRPKALRIARAGATGAIVCLGWLVTFAVMRIDTGSWDAFFQTQTKYHHGFHDPISVIVQSVRAVLRGAGGLRAVPSYEVVWMALVMLVVLGAALFGTLRLTGPGPGRYGRARPADQRHTAAGAAVPADLRAGLVLLGVLVPLWLLPLTQSNESFFRTDALLLPVAALVARLPAPLAAAMTIAGAVLMFLLARGFFAALYV